MWTLLDAVPDAVIGIDHTHHIVLANPGVERVFGYTASELIGQPLEILLPPAPSATHTAHVRAFATSTETIRPMGTRQAISGQHKGGRMFPAEASIAKVSYAGESILVAIVRDVTGRNAPEEAVRPDGETFRLLIQQKERAEALAQVSHALGESQKFDQALHLVAERVAALLGDACYVLLASDDHRTLRTAALDHRDQEAAALLAQLLAASPYRVGSGFAGRVMQTGEPLVMAHVTPEDVHTQDKPELLPYVERFGVSSALIVPLRTEGEILGVIGVTRDHAGEPYTTDDLTFVQDIAGRCVHAMVNARLYRDAQRRAHHLEALRTIDDVVLNTLDLRLTLPHILVQVQRRLKVDAADVLLLSPHSLTLTYGAGHGFRTDALKKTHLRLGAGNAGRAALERRIVHIPDLRTVEDAFAPAPLLRDEEFVSYYAAPLIAKGQVEGVLEVFHRAPFVADDEWLTFFQTLAGQTAIAIDSATLFTDLQRSNIELQLAYDATIEGWSRALDLRDRETEGHTQRVAEMTTLLARELGVSEAELVHVRRGALLHDMGKMGIPDTILLKPGTLTPDEWAIMRQHPQFAHDMLAPIAYLRPALDIPLFHHERWDGSGYPRGLKGEQIPLAARVFAVVDVWDALRSDRPYRKGWSEEQVRDHIREQAGSLFDPRIVEAFTNLPHPS